MSFGTLVQQAHAFVDSADGVNTVTATFPSAVTEGNLIVASHYTGDQDSIGPTGWSTAYQITEGASGYDEGGLYYKIASSSESQSVSCTSTGNNEAALVIAEFEGPIDATPLDSYVKTTYAVGGDLAIGPTATPSQADTIVICGAGGRRAGAEYYSPAMTGTPMSNGFTMVDIEHCANKWTLLGYKVLSSAAAQSTTLDFDTADTFGRHGGLAIFLKGASAGVPMNLFTYLLRRFNQS